MVVLDLLGIVREELSDELGLSIESINTYWKRVYRKTGRRGRPQCAHGPRRCWPRSWGRMVEIKGLACTQKRSLDEERFLL